MFPKIICSHYHFIFVLCLINNEENDRNSANSVFLNAPFMARGQNHNLAFASYRTISFLTHVVRKRWVLRRTLRIRTRRAWQIMIDQYTRIHRNIHAIYFGCLPSVYWETAKNIESSTNQSSADRGLYHGSLSSLATFHNQSTKRLNIFRSVRSFPQKNQFFAVRVTENIESFREKS